MKKVFVALSGGVDSAVAAHMLKESGWDVTGVFIRVWQPDFLPCSQDEEERSALRVAAALGVPFRRLDLVDEYKKDVVDEMISEYAAGRTPNPDVLCNASIKFGAFLKYAKSEGADKIATGHHAQVVENSGIYELHRGADPAKDQAYFLWKLTQDELSQTLMPIGHLQKDEVREYAEKHGIPSAAKPDSQGLCFIGHVDMKEFLRNFVTSARGNVLDTNGTIIGEHDGIEFVTLGQRGGFTLTNKDTQRTTYYVVSKDKDTNTITVATSPNTHTAAQKTISLRDVTWSLPPTENTRYQCEIRYHGEIVPCKVAKERKSGATIKLDDAVLVAPGQSLVVYDTNTCLGGGVVV